jgi:hypothetical protein
LRRRSKKAKLEPKPRFFENRRIEQYRVFVGFEFAVFAVCCKRFASLYHYASLWLVGDWKRHIINDKGNSELQPSRA